MHLPRLNGEVDAETVADIIVAHILAEISKIYGSRVDSETANRLRDYTKEKIELVKKETTNR